MGIIKIEGLTVAYDAKPVLWDINMEIEKGTLTAIVGPNGAGKSTLIKAILEFLKPISGNVVINGESYKLQRKNIAYVPQRESVDWDFPTTVLDLVEMGRYGHVGILKWVTKKDVQLSLESLEKVGMGEYKNRQISNLSGGQQQRVFLARALVQDAEIYFMDEPFQGVDAKTEKSIVEILKTLRNEGKTVVVVHHDLQTVPEYFDHVAFINKKLICYGPISEVFTEENIKTTYKSSVIVEGE